MRISIPAAILLLASSLLSAQRRFQVVSEDPVPGYAQPFFQNFSPDLKSSARSDMFGPGQALVIHTAATGQEQRVAVNCNMVGNVSWSPDGRFLFYVCWERKDKTNLYERRRYDPQTGQSDSKLGKLTRYSWPSPDEEHLLFRDGLSILLEEANGKPPRRLFIGPASVEGWNPDGSAILTQLTGSQGGFRLYLLSIADGSRKQLVGSHENAYLAFPKWLADGSGFFFCLFRAADSRRYRRSLWTDAAYTWEDSQIWFCSVPQGELHQVTQSAPGYLQLNGISPDGTTLMAIRNVYPPGFWELSARLFGQTMGMDIPKLVRLKLRSR